MPQPLAEERRERVLPQQLARLAARQGRQLASPRPPGPAQRELVPPPARPQALPWRSPRAWRERARPSPGSTKRLERGFRQGRPPELQPRRRGRPEPSRRSGQGARPEIFRPAWPQRCLACSRRHPPRHRGHGRWCLPSGFLLLHCSPTLKRKFKLIRLSFKAIAGFLEKRFCITSKPAKGIFTIRPNSNAI